MVGIERQRPFGLSGCNFAHALIMYPRSPRRRACTLTGPSLHARCDSAGAEAQCSSQALSAGSPDALLFKSTGTTDLKLDMPVSVNQASCGSLSVTMTGGQAKILTSEEEASSLVTRRRGYSSPPVQTLFPKSVA